MFTPSIEMVMRILPDATQVSEIKGGGQKAVYKATCKQYGQVVVKIMLPDVSVARLLREIKIVSENHFPNVPNIFRDGHIEVNGRQVLYIIEPYINGSDLRTILINQKQLSVPNTIILLNSLFETVIALEEKSVVHRDIKPENILFSTDGKYWLLDFGIARDLLSSSLTATNDHFGPHTAGYAAPEQFRNMKKKLDSKADLFSIGVVAYEVLTGNHPFRNGAYDYLDVLRRTENLKVEYLKIDGDTNNNLSRFIHCLMEKYPSRRPPTAKIAGSWFQQIITYISGGKK